MEKKTHAHKLFRDTSLMNYQVSKKTMSLKKQQAYDDDNMLS